MGQLMVTRHAQKKDGNKLRSVWTPRVRDTSRACVVGVGVEGVGGGGHLCS